MRTGWNSTEFSLTPSNVSGSKFGELFEVRLDATAVPQPLVVTNVDVAGSKHDVVYIATANNTVYAIDSQSGTLLAKGNLGAPPPEDEFPLREMVGITSTPVIDSQTGLLYVIGCTYENSAPTYRLHALDLATLNDALPSRVVEATGVLGNGKTVRFDAGVQRQRPALLDANGKIYAGFGSFGDLKENMTRGWLLGWNTADLSPLASNELVNQRAHSPGDCYRTGTGPCFLSSVWMSGFGPAADSHGNVFFVSGNSDVDSFDPPYNVQESAVKYSGSLRHLLDYFTPNQLNSWDRYDTDFGSGGLTIIPDQPGPHMSMAVAAGKSGTMYLLDRDDMGKHVDNPPDRVLSDVSIGKCWCGQSYFKGADGVGRVVSSGGQKVIVWQIKTSPGDALIQQSLSPALQSGQDPGFFTSVSSNGTKAGTAIVWAVGRPESDGGSVTLYAIDPKNGSVLYSAAVGSWPSGNKNANLVPIAANGFVYLAVGTDLFAFGLGGHAPSLGRAVATQHPGGPNELYGEIAAIDDATLALVTRSGQRRRVDAVEAMRANESPNLSIGERVGIEGHIDRSGLMHAQVIFRAKQSPALWPPDR